MDGAGSFSATLSGPAAAAFGETAAGTAGYTDVGEGSPTPFVLGFADAPPATQVTFYVQGPFVVGDTLQVETEAGSLILGGLVDDEYRSVYSRSWSLQIEAVSDGVIGGTVVAPLLADPERYGGTATDAGALRATFRAQRSVVELLDEQGR